MSNSRKIYLVIIVALLIGGATIAYYSNRSTSSGLLSTPKDTVVETKSEPKTEIKKTRREFSNYNATFRFSGELPHDWVVSYIKPTAAIAVFHSQAAAKDLNNASIFMRYFNATSFQTLSTINILSEESIKINSHMAVRYEIEKKDGVANFTNQPGWRSAKHQLVDIRYAPAGQTTFFVFAYRPDLRQEIFNDFINSISFHNDKSSVIAPLDRVSERVTKKSFGTKVSPTNSPVQPERFSGYHTGWDFETFANERNKDIAVTAICGGTLRTKTTASGYGGYAVQECDVAGQEFTVVYGHLRLASITADVGDYLAPGEKIGLLGNHESRETDGERKHLHLSLHKGSSTNIRGYVSTKAELSDWIDPDTYL